MSREKGVVLALIGSRKFNNYAIFCEFVHECIDVSKVSLIISGGAVGCDKLAELFASDNGIPIKVIKPDYKKYYDRPKFAPLARNQIIAMECDKMIAFIYEDSNGTKYTIEQAKVIGKEVFIKEL